VPVGAGLRRAETFRLFAAGAGEEPSGNSNYGGSAEKAVAVRAQGEPRSGRHWRHWCRRHRFCL